MKEEVGDLWRKHSEGYWIVIPTNLQIDKYGHAIMGAGLAKEAALRFPNLPVEFGLRLSGRLMGDTIFPFTNYRVICFTTKYKWRYASSIDLIYSSAAQLADAPSDIGSIYLPRVGCGLGLLSWEDVKPVLERHLDDRFVVLSRE